MSELPFKPETQLEDQICKDPEWQTGVNRGSPRKAYPEGKVIFHIEAVLSNIDKLKVPKKEQASLRFIALIHDTFKYKIGRHQLKINNNNHAMIARKFAQKYIQDDRILDIIELHDDAHNAYAWGKRRGDLKAAEKRAKDLIASQ